jgi:ATP-dependent DNA ligase
MMPGFEYWAMLEPMKYYDKKREDLSDNLKKKYDAMINNENNEYIATCKYDGEWTMFIKWDGQYLIRSRSLSKVTGAYGDKTAHLPHLVEDMQNWPDNTVVLGEVCWGDFGSVSTDVGTILRCLPAKAVERQKEHKLVVKVFDVLAYAGHVYMDNDYETRTEVIGGVFGNAPEANDKYFTATYFCPNGMTPAEFADAIINQGGEGVVIQRKDYVYEPGKRSAWKTLKLKQRLPEMEFKVVASIPATKEYNGKYPESWPYVIDGECVTKPYYYGWHMGVRFEYNGVMCDASSGLTDADREWLGTEEAQNIIKNGELYVTIRAMQEASLGGLRHPVVVRLRTDM